MGVVVQPWGTNVELGHSTGVTAIVGTPVTGEAWLEYRKGSGWETWPEPIEVVDGRGELEWLPGGTQVYRVSFGSVSTGVSYSGEFQVETFRKIDKVMPIALQYVGVPYVLGGKTPRGFDCSGFTRWVYAEVGVALPESAREQARVGKVVAEEDARPGDLLAWPGHIAIYAGDGMRIDANRPGSTVQVRPIFGNPKYIQVLP